MKPLDHHVVSRIIHRAWQLPSLSVMGNPTPDQDGSKYYKREDVQAAVGWLLDQFEETFPEGSMDHEKGHSGTYTALRIKQDIKRAFPDVIGKKSELLDRVEFKPITKDSKSQIIVTIEVPGFKIKKIKKWMIE